MGELIVGFGFGSGLRGGEGEQRQVEEQERGTVPGRALDAADAAQMDQQHLCHGGKIVVGYGVGGGGVINRLREAEPDCDVRDRGEEEGVEKGRDAEANELADEEVVARLSGHSLGGEVAGEEEEAG